MTLYIRLGKFNWEQDRRQAVKECMGKKYGHSGRRIIYSKLTIKGKLRKLFYMGNNIMKLCWQKRFLFFDYGWDDSFGTGIIKNSVSFAISFKGHWVGI